MAGNFKAKPTPTPNKRPVAIKAPDEKSGVPMSMGNGDKVLKQSSPDGPRAGYAVLPSGQRVYKDEIPYPPPTPDRKPFKVTK